jgi:hypothetical protein
MKEMRDISYDRDTLLAVIITLLSAAVVLDGVFRSLLRLAVMVG